MRLIAESTLIKFSDKHPESQQVIQAWYKVFKSCSAADFNELKLTFNSADYVPPKYTVFNVSGNEYRIILNIHYNAQRAFVRFVGTHAEYKSWTTKNRKK
jgi:mRNA interferase HigB